MMGLHTDLIRFVLMQEVFTSIFQEYTYKIGKNPPFDIEGNNTFL